MLDEGSGCEEWHESGEDRALVLKVTVGEEGEESRRLEKEEEDGSRWRRSRGRRMK